MSRSVFALCLLSVSLSPLMLPTTQADEGMWLFNDLPREQLRSKYGFDPTPEWARHLMLSSVRFNSGGSASFISSTGLVLTNHHVGAETLHQLSTADHNYYQEGFYAETLEEELRAPELELNQLVEISDVTQQVDAAVKAGLPADEAAAARRAAMAEIEKKSLDETGLRSDVVELYGGARYHLYRYKKYTDVRLVWAPEASIAFFGGDADNFEYPRWCLDVCIFRVYEDDKPAEIEHFLPISRSGVEDGELVFVSGNPGRTDRIFTVAALKYQRDQRLPYTLNFLRRREILYQQYGLEGPEQKRQAMDDLFGIQNSRKAYTGMLEGLQDPRLIQKKEEAERQLKKALAEHPTLKENREAWDEIEQVQEERAAMLGQTAGLASRPYSIAQTLVLMAAEDLKPNSERLREYRESARASLVQQLFSPAPIYPEFEQLQLADSFALFIERRGGDHPLVTQMLAGKGPQARAAELIHGTRLTDLEVRKKLAAGGFKAIETSDDPLIQLARLMEPETRRIRKIEETLDERERQAYAKISEAHFAIQGTETYPDATFTLRLAFGTVDGYHEKGRKISPWTTLGGAFEHEQRHQAEGDWKLPESWHVRKDGLDLSTPFNFVCTADIVGGNSGSPIINRQGQLVGVIFDGNIQSLIADYVYTEEQSRAVAVHSAALLETLGKLYGTDRILKELEIAAAVVSKSDDTLPHLSAERTEEGVLVKEGERKVLFYQQQTRSQDGRYPRAGYVHPLWHLDGTVMTEDFPGDHLHHRGIFWAWHQLRVGQQSVGDPWTCEDIEWDVQQVKTRPLPGGALELDCDVVWKSLRLQTRAGDSLPVVRESTVIRIHPSDPEARLQKIDFQISLRAAVAGVRLGGSDDRKGYGGFSVRVKLPEDVKFQTTYGEAVPRVTSVEPSPWLDITGSFDGKPRKGLAILTAPKTPGFPPRWILRRQRSMQNPVYPGREPVELSETDPLTLRYQLVLHQNSEQSLDFDSLMGDLQDLQDKNRRPDTPGSSR